MMNIAQIRPSDIANGSGVRVSIFVSGCKHNCPNCFNKEYQDFSYGKVFDKKDEDKLFDLLSKTEIKGLTLLGGEPMEHPIDLSNMLIRLKNRLDEKSLKKDFWIYSGFTLEEICEDEDKLALLKECDILVDGPFIEELKDPSLKFRGSKNQRIIEINKLNL